MAEEQIESQTEITGHWSPPARGSPCTDCGHSGTPRSGERPFRSVCRVARAGTLRNSGESAWWIALFGLSSIVFLLTERVARRALPLAILLRLALGVSR